MAVPLEQFVKRLEESGILSGESLADFIPPKASPADAEQLARELVRQKKLTVFQAETVYRGQGKSLALGNYILIEKIGAGGMGQVYKARHRRMDRLVAIKLLPQALTKDPAAIARFEREVKAAAKLRHPNIVAADDADCANGVHFLVMECVDGSDLSALVKKQGPLPVAKAVNCILQTARGLEFAHKKGVVHRDIKPANLLLDTEGVVKILDMGLAKIDAHGDVGAQAELTGTGMVMGTVDYMAPEQALSTKTADARADIYSLGCSLYYLLTGKATYGGDSLMAKLLAHRDQPIPDLRANCAAASPELETVFRRMMAKKVQDRYQSMSEVIADLERLGLDPQSSLSRQTPVTQQLDSHAFSFLNDVHDSPGVRPTQALTKSTTARKTGAPPSQKPLWQQPLVVGAAIGVLVLALLAGIIVSLQTKAGKLVVEIDQPDATVQVLDAEGKVEVTQKAGANKVTISVDPGKHRLKITKEGFKFYGREFEMESGGKETLSARLVPDDEPVMAEATATEPAFTESGFTEPALTESPSRKRPFVRNQPRVDKSSRAGSGTPARSKATPIFTGRDLAGWQLKGDAANWEVDASKGVLMATGKAPIGWMFLDRGVGDFVLTLEYQAEPGSNSGIAVLGSSDDADHLEIQVGDTPAWPTGGVWSLPKRRDGGGFIAPPQPAKALAAGEWNTLQVQLRSRTLEVAVNGVAATPLNLDELSKDPDAPPAAKRTTGRIGLQSQEGVVRFRRIRLVEDHSTDGPPSGELAATLPADASEFEVSAFGKHVYKFFPQVLTWHQAKARCAEYGGSLALVTSQAEHDFVTALAKQEIPQLGNHGVWLGATDEQKEGEWHWIDGSALEFTAWGPQQPNNKGNSEHYLMLYLAESQWSDQPDTSVQHTTYFVCEWDDSKKINTQQKVRVKK